MKIFLLPLFFILFQTFVYAQAKFDEYALTDSDSEAMRLYNFFDKLKERPEDKGLIVIYAERNSARLGNVVSFTNGVKSQLGYFSLKDRVSVVVAEGNTFLFKELWLIGKNDGYPKFKPIDLDFLGLQTTYFYAFDCLSCDPAVSELYSGEVDLENYAEILKGNLNYQGVIEISTGDYPGRTPRQILREARRYASEYRRTLRRDYKIPDNRLTIKIKRSPDKDSVTTANLYLVPAKKN